MKKKISILAAAVICAFGLTACGSSEEYTEWQSQKIEYAESYAASAITYLGYTADGTLDTYYGVIPWDEFTMDEISSVVNSIFEINADGYGFYNGITSFASAYEDLGAILVVDTDNMTSTVDDDQIIVDVPVSCEKGEATAEIIYSNDQFLVLESASITQNFTMGQKMGKAGLNTLIGMGTVFIVLILICLIISLFGVIPKLQKKAADKKSAKAAESKAAETGIENAVNQIIAGETVTEEDDGELAAVIAAAIAAYEEASGSSGYVVRSIRRRR